MLLVNIYRDREADKLLYKLLYILCFQLIVYPQFPVDFAPIFYLCGRKTEYAMLIGPKLIPSSVFLLIFIFIFIFSP